MRFKTYTTMIFLWCGVLMSKGIIVISVADHVRCGGQYLSPRWFIRTRQPEYLRRVSNGHMSHSYIASLFSQHWNAWSGLCTGCNLPSHGWPQVQYIHNAATRIQFWCFSRVSSISISTAGKHMCHARFYQYIINMKLKLNNLTV